MQKTTVTITVEVDGKQETFTATAETGGSPFRAAQGLLSAVRNDASEWVSKQATAKGAAEWRHQEESGTVRSAAGAVGAALESTRTSRWGTRR